MIDFFVLFVKVLGHGIFRKLTAICKFEGEYISFNLLNGIFRFVNIS